MEVNSSPRIINLSGSLNVERAAALKTELAEALAGDDKLLLGFSAAEELDLPCLQVIIAAKKSAEATGKELHFMGSLPRGIAKRLAACGFLRDSSDQADGLESSLTGF
jgi:anti-anti-sigma regulatory factor